MASFGRYGGWWLILIPAKPRTSPAGAPSRLHVVAAVSQAAAAHDTYAAPAHLHTAKSCPTPSPTATHPPLAAPTRLCPPVPPDARSTSRTPPASRVETTCEDR